MLKVDSNQTNHMCHITSTHTRDYFLRIWFFSSLSHADSSFMGASDVSHLRKVSYKRTFGMPDQGQTLVRVREPDHWVSSEMTDAPYRATSYSWSCSWSYSWTCAWDKDHDIFNPGSHSNSLSLPRNWYRRESHDLICSDSLGIVPGLIVIK